MELRSRVIAFVEEGHGHREAARHFRVSPRFVNDMVILKRESGGLLAKAQGNRAAGKLARYSAWLCDRLAVKGDLTLDEIVAELAAGHGVTGHGVTVHRGSVGKWLHRLGLSHKKRCSPANNCGPTWPKRAGSGLSSASRTWPTCWKGWSSLTRPASRPTSSRPPAGPRSGRASTTTPASDTGNTPTFIAGLAHGGLIAPWVLDGAMNRASFDAAVGHQRAPALKPGQIVIADTLSSHKSPRAQALLRAQGNNLIFLPPYSPDLNPIEMAFSKLKTLIRKAAARPCQALWTCVGAVCDLFPSQECTNYFKAAGYGLD